MPNDLKLGGADVADLRYGSLPVAKVMLGSTLVWEPGAPPAFAPTLTDSFVGTTTVNASTKNFNVPVGKTIPIGSLLVVGAAINGTYLPTAGTDNATGAGAANTYVRVSDTTFIQAANVFGALLLAKVTREIVAGRTISVTHVGTNRTRGAAVIAWFADAAHFPSLAVNGSMPANEGSGTNWATGGQSSDSTAPTLDLAMTYGTGAAPPYGHTTTTKIGEATTAAGSSDRSVSLGYRVSPAAGDRSAAGTNTDAVWGAALAAIPYAA